jgi:hypothetical protein
MATWIGTGTADPGDDLKVGNHKVGIGTTTFLSPLDFSTDFGNKILTYPYAADNSDGFGTQFGLFQMFTHNAGNIAFGYGGSGSFTEWMRINSSGRVGIGTTSPSCELDVVGTAKASTAVKTPAIRPVTDGQQALQVQNANGSSTVLNVDTTNSRVGIGTTGPEAELEVAGGSGTKEGVLYVSKYIASTASPAYLAFQKSHSNTVGTKTTTTDGEYLGGILACGVGTAVAEFIGGGRIDFIQEGNAADWSLPTRIEFLVGDGVASCPCVMVIKHTGAVGIGETSPGSALEIDKDAGGSQKGFITMEELGADASAPAANKAALFVRDNGSGKTQLCVKFNTGAVQVLATQP